MGLSRPPLVPADAYEYAQGTFWRTTPPEGASCVVCGDPISYACIYWRGEATPVGTPHQPRVAANVSLHRACALTLARHLLNDVERYDRAAERLGLGAGTMSAGGRRARPPPCEVIPTNGYSISDAATRSN
jgi:hypothetical protein